MRVKTKMNFQITKAKTDYQITTAVNDIYQDIVKNKKLFETMYHFWALGLVYGTLHNKLLPNKARSADIIRIQQIHDETITDVINICYSILDDGKGEREVFNKMLSHADAGIVELTKLYEKNGSFILPVVLEDAKEIWATRVKELRNINLEDL